MIIYYFVENRQEHYRSWGNSQATETALLGLQFCTGAFWCMSHVVLWGLCLGLVQPLSPRLGSGGLDNLLIQFQVLSLYQRTGILLEAHMRNGLHERAGWPLTTDWINLPGSTVVSLSFCNSGEHWTAGPGALGGWADGFCVHTCHSLAWQSWSAGVDALQWIDGFYKEKGCLSIIKNI